MKYIPVIGLEVHLQLKTASKIFCGCSTRFGAPPNTQVCPVCLGFPGVLPVLNRRALALGIRVALALYCRIQPRIVFHRKNYFYPDLPKGFQISQYDLPLGTDGFVEIPRRIRIHRAHLEEDAGKLIHAAGYSLVDFNRTGVPLLEIVTEPDLTSPEEATQYLKTLKGILEYLEVSDCDMEKGSLRCDTNISLRPAASAEGVLGTKVEIKNLNSFKAVARSLGHEIRRQAGVLEEGGKIDQETRLWDDEAGITQGMRSKEYAHDYRYFPEPDLVPFAVAAGEVENIRKNLPELPAQRAHRFARQYHLPEADSRLLTSSKQTADYFEAAVKAAPVSTKTLANWRLGGMAGRVNDRNLDAIAGLKFTPGALAELAGLIESGKISGKMAKEVFADSLDSGRSPGEIVKAKGLSQVTDRSALEAAAGEILKENPQAVGDFKKGKDQALMFLVGQLMKRTRGAASPAISQEVLLDLLKKETK